MKRTSVVLFAVVMGMSVAVAGCASEEPETESELSQSVDEFGKSDRLDCSLVRCALPLCSDGQHLRYQGGCCPVCVGHESAPSRCATVLCLAVECAADEIAVTSAGQCCPRCVKAPAVKECQDDLDCPQYSCIQCPCPTSECQGNRCVTRTPDASTCGGDTL